MHGLPALDAGRTIDWGRTSADYAAFRPGPPESFYQRLSALGVGLPGQSILDLGCGTGVLARRFARAGCHVLASDISAGQIDAAKALAQAEDVTVDFRVAAAEASEFPAGSVDVATANQCWLYFDHAAVLAQLRRVLRPGGLLVTSHFSWLPRLDAVARASEALVLRVNPQWQGADWPSEIPPLPRWAEAQPVRLRAMFWYDEPVAFTRAGWAGRMRACRGVAAALPAQDVARFDAEHVVQLAATVPEQFTVLHRIDAHLFELV